MKHLLFALALLPCLPLQAESVVSPDGLLRVDVRLDNARPCYTVQYDGRTVIPYSPLGLVANWGNLAEGLSPVSSTQEQVSDMYALDRIKQSQVEYVANRLVCTYANAEGRQLSIEFEVSDNNVAFRYTVPRQGETGSIRVMEERTGFAFASGTKAFVTPQSDAMVGWKRTKPSYEEEYAIGTPVGQAGAFGHGFTFPCLFSTMGVGERQTAGQQSRSHKQKEEQPLWVLISETGVGSRYCGSRLSDPVWKVGADSMALYSIAFPMPEENNGNGTSEPAFSLPGSTPWRTITVAPTLAPIAETTIAWDVVRPLYEPSKPYSYGKGTWSWIVWQDNSINYDDQKTYIDLAAQMGFQFTLVDNYWDTQIGRERMVELQGYAVSRGVDLFVWYSSSGYWNDIVQGPTNRMDDPIRRKQEMKWLRSIGVKGIKVDFFGGDKQETMRLYEQILADANEYGLMVIFHGCTLPRGWERMYPNYVGSEAVLASENLYFDPHHCEIEAESATLHPFIRNAVGAMEYGGCFMNRYMSRDNRSRHARQTTDVFQLATCVLYQNPVQNFAITPNNFSDYADGFIGGNEGSPAPKVCMDFIRDVPTTWDETRLLDGYPGRYVALARRKAERWYIAVISASEEPLSLSLDLSSLSGLQEDLRMISGGNAPALSVPKVRKGHLSLTLRKNDGVVLY